MNIGGLVEHCSQYFLCSRSATSPVSAALLTLTKRRVEQARARFCAARVFIRRHDGNSERAAPAAGPSCSGTDSRPCRVVLGRMVSLAEVEALARTRFDHLGPDARDISHSGLRNRRAPTLARRYQRRHRGTCCAGHQLGRACGHYPSRDGSSGSGTAPAASSSRRAQVLSGLKSGLKSPLLWGPVLGIAVVLAGLRIPKDIQSCFEMIGSATSGVAVFTVGLTLAAHAFQLSKAVLLATLGRITVQTAVLFALLHLLHVQSPFAREALVCCSFPLATIVVLLAAKYKAMEAESASALLLSTLSLVASVPIIIAVSR